MKRGVVLVVLLFVLSIYSVDAVLVWKEDFEDQDYLDTFFTQSSDLSCAGNGYNALVTTTHQSQNGDYSLRFDSCAVTVDSITGLAGCNDIDLYIGDPSPSGIVLGDTHNISGAVESTNEIYVKYWTKYDSGVPLAEEYLVVDWFRFPENGYIAFDANAPSQNPLSAHTYESFVLNDYSNPLSAVNIYDNNWHKMEYYVNYDYNGLGESNITGWIDDQLVLDWQGPTINGRPDYIRVHRLLEGESSCFATPIQIDDIEVWNEIPNLPSCSNGEILSMCECGGSTRDYGYCTGDVWSVNPPLANCVINNAYWTETEVDMGTQVSLIVNGTDCDGQQVDFQMYEHDSFIGDYEDVTSQLVNPPSSISFTGNTATVSWVTEWVEDNGFTIDSNPEYIFNASLNTDLTQFALSEELKVNYIISSCVNGEITVPCDCGGTTYDIGDGYCCDNSISVDPCPTIETILDNGDSGTTSSGSWSTSTYWPNYYGTEYMYSLPETQAGLWYQWDTNLDPGTYEVYAWWTNATDRPYDVNYTITGVSVNEVNGVDQRINGGQWSLLGTYDFDGASSVRVVTGSTGAGGTCADAVRFLKTESTSDLILYLPFEGDMLDYSGNNYDGSCVNCPDLTTGYNGSGSAYNFNGVDDIITVADNNDLDLSGDYSIAYWVKAGSYPAAWNIISKEHYQSDTVNAGYVFDGYNNDFYFYPNSNSDAGTNAVTTAVSSNDWMHITVTYDSTSPLLRLYIDGVLMDANSVSVSPAPHTNDLHIGSSTTPDRYFDGSIDELRIYNKVLNLSEIQDLSYVPGPECTIDADCDHLDQDYCSGTQLMHTEGVCNAGSCGTNDTLTEDCYWRSYASTYSECVLATGNIGQYASSEWSCSAGSCVDLGTPALLQESPTCNNGCGYVTGVVADQDLCYDLSQTTCPQINYDQYSCNGDVLVEYACDGNMEDAFNTTTDCNTLDGWVNITGPEQWIPYGDCTELKQIQQSYYDYFCYEGTVVECTYGAGATDSRWINTTETRSVADGTSCDDGLACTENDQCNSGICGGSQVDCSGNDLAAVATCFNTPDSLDWTWDSRLAFTSTCQEPTGTCTSGDATINHICDQSNCGAECELNSDCNPTDCDLMDGCVGNDYYDYDNVDNDCLNDCSCEANSCAAPTITTNSPLCVACTIDDDCNGLDDDFCFGTEVRHTEGICNASFECEAQTTTVEDCANQDNSYCSGDDILRDVYTCSAASCGLDQTITEQSCDDGLFCNGDETCSGASCQSGTAPVIDDAVTCTEDSCDEVNDLVVNNPNDSLCDDGNTSTIDTCDSVNDCTFTPITNAMNQTIVLNEGWNLVNVWIDTNATSEDLNSVFVMNYETGQWEIDWNSIQGDEFDLTSLKGYLVYSLANRTVELSGFALPSEARYEFEATDWNLFSTQYASTFSVLYSDFVGLNYGIYQLTEFNGNIGTVEIAESDVLNPASLYWINLEGPEMAPPLMGFFQILVGELASLFSVPS